MRRWPRSAGNQRSARFSTWRCSTTAPACTNSSTRQLHEISRRGCCTLRCRPVSVSESDVREKWWSKYTALRWHPGRLLLGEQVRQGGLYSVLDSVNNELPPQLPAPMGLIARQCVACPAAHGAITATRQKVQARKQQIALFLSEKCRRAHIRGMHLPNVTDDLRTSISTKFPQNPLKNPNTIRTLLETALPTLSGNMRMLQRRALVVGQS